MKRQESEDLLRSYGHNDSIEFKSSIYEYTTRTANPVLLTICRNNVMYIPIFV